MSKQHKFSNSHDMDEKRVPTAPIRQRPKYNDYYKNSNVELPMIKGKNLTRYSLYLFSESKRTKKQQVKSELEYEQTHKRPQTSKGSRGNKVVDSEYYEEEGDDLIVTSMHQKIDLFKKKNSPF